MSDEHWLASRRETQLWSGPDEHAVAWALVPQGSFFLQLEPPGGSRVHVKYFGNSTLQAGDVWVGAQEVDPTTPQHGNKEPDWPTGSGLRPVVTRDTNRDITALLENAG